MIQDLIWELIGDNRQVNRLGLMAYLRIHSWINKFSCWEVNKLWSTDAKLKKYLSLYRNSAFVPLFLLGCIQLLNYRSTLHIAIAGGNFTGSATAWKTLSMWFSTSTKLSTMNSIHLEAFLAGSTKKILLGIRIPRYIWYHAWHIA